ncbi:MAG: helix-turn-helix transcriptional regulator [Firmicutes bacterium]|nr:helix-turn-helix transcriptional regulator [Bacillota bacterium]
MTANSNLLGERLAWARNQQGMILQQVSERSGLAVGYISQLEKGAKKNPTISALERLARALNVSVAFLLGEVAGPTASNDAPLLAGRDALAIGQRFARYLESLSRAERERIMFATTIEQRFGLVVDFLCREFPDVYTRAVVAYQLGMSVRALNDVLERQVEVGFVYLSRLSTATGIPIEFFSQGDLRRSRSVANLSSSQILHYITVVALAAEMQVDPEVLCGMIRERFGR